MTKVRAIAVLALTGCSGSEVAADYSLQLVPRFIEGQGLLDEEPEIKLLIDHPDGTREVRHAGQATSGAALRLEGLGPLAAGTVVGVIAEEAGSTGDEWKPDATLAYGQAVVGEDLAVGAQEAELEVLVASTSEVAKLGSQGSNKQRLGGRLVVVPGGDAYIFGGGDPYDVGYEPVASNSVLKLSGIDQGETSFTKVGTMPSSRSELGDYGGQTVTDRASVSATVVDIDGQPMILVAGGRASWWITADNVPGWFLWNPADDTIFDQGNMKVDRSDHLAIPFGNGDLLLFGGLSGYFLPSSHSYEIFDAERRRTVLGTNTDRLDVGLWNVFGAPLDGDVVICGGTRLAGYVWTPTDACNRLQLDGDVEAFAALPLPLGAAAMAPLPNGELLVTGGFVDIVEDEAAGGGYTTFGVVPAVDNAFVYDLETDDWRGVGQMNHARAHHQMVPLADGRVLVVGGTGIATAIYGDIAEPVRCPEIYDPDGDTFTEIECTNVGQGADPMVGHHPGEGAVVVEGTWLEGFTYFGAAEYGVISTGPPAQP